MEDRTLEPIRTGTSTARRGTGLSRTSSHSTARSRASRPSSPYLQRIYSSHYIDDYNVYHHDDAAANEEDREEVEEQDHEDVVKEDEKPVLATQQSKESDENSESSELSEMAKQEPDEIPQLAAGADMERDLEAGRTRLAKQQSRKTVKDPNLVTWDGPDDPANPKNWSTKRRWLATIVVSSFTFISPVSSSMIAPSISAISAEFHITSTPVQQLVLSIFVLAYAIGPLFLGPLSELYGRVRVLQLANAFYFAWNLGCGFSQNTGQILAFRFLSGLGGSAPLAIGGGLISDCWKPEERGRAIAIYSLAPLLGPSIGPIAGGFITQNTTWRWCFWATCIATVFIQLSGVFFLQETYVPELLKRKKLRLIKETGNQDLYTEYDDPNRTFRVHLRTAIVRPFRLIGTQPIIQLLAVYQAYVYGVMYLVLSTFSSLWTDEYGESLGVGGLNYISLGVGFFLGTQIGAPLNDGIYKRLKARNGGVGRSEFRVPLMFPGSILMPVGLFWYGWTAQTHQQWILPNIGAAIFAAGVIMIFQGSQTYVIDAYTRFAASAIASTTVLRSMAGFGFPLFAPAMYNALGDGWGNSVLGFIAIAIGIPVPFILWRYGEKLRAKSKFAAGD